MSMHHPDANSAGGYPVAPTSAPGEAPPYNPAYGVQGPGYAGQPQQHYPPQQYTQAQPAYAGAVPPAVAASGGAPAGGASSTPKDGNGDASGGPQDMSNARIAKVIIAAFSWLTLLFVIVAMAIPHWYVYRVKPYLDKQGGYYGLFYGCNSDTGCSVYRNEEFCAVFGDKKDCNNINTIRASGAFAFFTFFSAVLFAIVCLVVVLKPQSPKLRFAAAGLGCLTALLGMMSMSMFIGVTNDLQDKFLDYFWGGGMAIWIITWMLNAALGIASAILK